MIKNSSYSLSSITPATALPVLPKTSSILLSVH